MEFFETKVIDIVKETSDSYSFKLEIPQGFTWEAGQYTMWKFVDHKVEEGDRPVRVFTIASAPEDGYLMFTTRIAEDHTSWKNILLNDLKVGDKMMVAKAKGEFNFHGNYKESFVIAGGIGITPIRSLLKHFSENNNEDHKLVVLYSDDRGEFCYKYDFKEITDKMPNLELLFICDRDEFTAEVEKYAKEKQNNAEYLIAGSPGMNKVFSEKLEGLGVNKDNIKVDNFMGY